MASRRARVALVDRHALLTDCLATTLEGIGYDTRIIFVPTPPLAVTVEQAVREVRSLAPRVVILGSNLGPHGESEALLTLLAASGVPVIVLAQGNDEPQWGTYVARGAWCVIPQTASLALMCAAVRHLAARAPVMMRAEQRRLIAAYRAESGAIHQERDHLARLSPTETEILRLLMAGWTTVEVARSRVVSVSTVRTQVKWILSKLEVHSQVAAVATAYRAGWAADTVGVKSRAELTRFALDARLARLA